MKKLMSFVKPWLSRVWVSGLTILLLCVSTACSQPNSTLGSTASPYRSDTEKAPEGQITELYRQIQPAEGGMNKFSDVDPRQGMAKAKAKADKLVQQAPHEIRKQKVDNPVDAVKQELKKEPLDQRVQKFSSDVSKSAQEKADDLSDEATKGMKNIDKNAKNFGKDVKSTADDLTENVQKTAKNAGDAVKQTGAAISDKAQQGADKVQDFVKNS